MARTSPPDGTTDDGRPTTDHRLPTIDDSGQGLVGKAQTTGDRQQARGAGGQGEFKFRSVVGGRWSVVIVTLLVVAAALVPQVVKRDDILNLLFQVCLFITLAQSWNILAGLAGQTSLGHA